MTSTVSPASLTHLLSGKSGCAFGGGGGTSPNTLRVESSRLGVIVADAAALAAPLAAALGTADANAEMDELLFVTVERTLSSINSCVVSLLLLWLLLWLSSWPFKELLLSPAEWTFPAFGSMVGCPALVALSLALEHAEPMLLPQQLKNERLVLCVRVYMCIE
jgi:hypothetical protein